MKCVDDESDPSRDAELLIHGGETAPRTEAESSQLNISDVIEVIRTTDPRSAEAMFNTVNEVSPSDRTNPQIQQNNNTQNATTTMRGNNVYSHRGNALVRIIEQPASKALRFRYECEGRSAGSIPGVNSTPENKTYPSIEIVGYKGRAVVVVSCVTRDPPYRPHPHNLVGREGCKKGVCTMEIKSETMSVSFSNLGIQCVKKKDIEDALKVREEIRVDPFRTGFSHRSQPSSIDLNSVRLCFQVFLENPEKERNFTIPLPPVVSDPIFDKKAMSDLVICKMSDCTSTVAGGKEIILLCEKVAKEDISVRFYEEINGEINWEGLGDFPHTNVHKQVAISFRTPRYKTLEVDQPIKCFVQLLRPSDGCTSDPLSFEYLPLDSGRRSILDMRKKLKEQGSLDFFENLRNAKDDILSILRKTEQIPDSTTNNKENEVIVLDTPVDDQMIFKPASVTFTEINAVDSIDKTSEWVEKSQFVQQTTEDGGNKNKDGDVDDDLNRLLEQVAELDEIYADQHMKKESSLERELNRLEQAMPSDPIESRMDIDDIFDDTATYTSLQQAFKNPVPIIDLLPPSPPSIYDPNALDSLPSTPLSPVSHDGCSLKRDSPTIDDCKLPPLPPKRTKKTSLSPDNVDGNETHFITTKSDYDSDSLPNTPERLNRSPNRPQSQIYIMRTPDQSPRNRSTPASPKDKKSCSSPLPKQKKPGFFSKLFSRRKSKSDIGSNTSIDGKESQSQSQPQSQAISREPSINHFDIHDPNRLSTRSIKSLQIPTKKPHGKPVGRSVSSVSGKRPHLTADITHIPLKGDSTDSLGMRNGSGTMLSLPGSMSYGSTVTLSHHLDRKTVSALQLADLPLQDGNMELIAIADAQSLKNLCEGEYGVKIDPSVDLTEAEHFALYTSVAPYATQSEFDENSCYYAPVEHGEILETSEVVRRLTDHMENNY